MEGQKPRMLGKNMKARGISKIDGSAEETATAVEAHDPTDLKNLRSVEDSGPEDTTLDADTVAIPSGADLVAVTEQKRHAIDMAIDPLGILAGLLEKSREQTEAETVLIIPTAEEIEAIETGDLVLEGDPATLEAIAAGKHKRHHRQPLPEVGPQLNGDYGVVVMVPEQLVAGVLGQAELEKVTPSEWLTVRMGEMLEGWFHGR